MTDILIRFHQTEWKPSLIRSRRRAATRRWPTWSGSWRTTRPSARRTVLWRPEWEKVDSRDTLHCSPCPQRPQVNPTLCPTLVEMGQSYRPIIDSTRTVAPHRSTEGFFFWRSEIPFSFRILEIETLYFQMHIPPVARDNKDFSVRVVWRGREGSATPGFCNSTPSRETQHAAIPVRFFLLLSEFLLPLDSVGCGLLWWYWVIEHVLTCESELFTAIITINLH